MIGLFGATGFIGANLARRLIASNEQLRLVSRRIDANFISEFGASAGLVEANLLDPSEMSSSLVGIDTVVQLIGTSSPGFENKNIVADIRDNVIRQIEFLELCANAGVRRFIFVSSGGAIYGPNAPVPTSEDIPCAPINSHGLTKLTVENYLRMYGALGRLEYIILRVSNLFGPGQKFRRGQGLVPAILERYRRNMPVRIFGDGGARRDYLFIDDLIDAIERAIRLPDGATATINVGRGESRSVLEVIEAIEAATGRALEKQFLPARATDIAESRLNIERARALLGWMPATDFQSGIQKTVVAAMG